VYLLHFDLQPLNVFQRHDSHPKSQWRFKAGKIGLKQTNWILTTQYGDLNQEEWRFHDANSMLTAKTLPFKSLETRESWPRMSRLRPSATYANPNPLRQGRWGGISGADFEDAARDDPRLRGRMDSDGIWWGCGCWNIAIYGFGMIWVRFFFCFPQFNVWKCFNKLLVGGFKHFFIFPFHIWDVILPIDELIFFRGVGIPPTRW